MCLGREAKSKTEQLGLVMVGLMWAFKEEETAKAATAGVDAM